MRRDERDERERERHRELRGGRVDPPGRQLDPGDMTCSSEIGNGMKPIKLTTQMKRKSAAT